MVVVVVVVVFVAVVLGIIGRFSVQVQGADSLGFGLGVWFRSASRSFRTQLF